MSDQINHKKNKLFPQRKIFRLKEVDSTNMYASQLPYDTPEGSIVITEFQKKGRGQGLNKWESAPGENIMLSIILHPNFIKANQQFYISKTIALAVADFVALYTDRVTIKWPNDIYIENKKIAGILIEHAIENDNIKQTIAGIGININQQNFPSGLLNPISLRNATGEKYEINDLINIFISLADNRYLMLKEGDLETIDENYRGSLFRFNVKSKFSADGKIFMGTITGIDSMGELEITDEQGKINKFLNKEVEFILE
jgi:BirA family biotin operon repressor/biotin-[acetyl-CoA-carboxylase] ligase